LFDTPSASQPQTPVERAADLRVIQTEVAACTRCSELVAHRSQTVFGVGNPAARICFVGEAPGADEDRLGEPFVGRAGQLLNDILKACTLSREEVYILNVIKCRPPGNRIPNADEVENCRGYLERQLETIRPEFICCLGSVAASALLRTKASIGHLRGRFHDWRGIRILVTYHPAYLLRNPAAKKDVWHDMQWLMSEMGIPLNRRPLPRAESQVWERSEFRAGR
jgi:DNA polymerase